MSGLSRRSFLAVSAAVVAAPSVVRAQGGADLDVAIIGAGAAGIAAARRIAAAKRRFVLLEASDRIGGRCVTDTTIFGVPFDLGAHWIHRPDGSLLTGSAQATALDIYSLRAGRRFALVLATRGLRAGDLRSLPGSRPPGHRRGRP